MGEVTKIAEHPILFSGPMGELAKLLNEVEAARACVREWEPSRSEKARGAGTGVGMRAAEDALIREMSQ